MKTNTWRFNNLNSNALVKHGLKALLKEELSSVKFGWVDMRNKAYLVPEPHFDILLLIINIKDEFKLANIRVKLKMDNPKLTIIVCNNEIEKDYLLNIFSAYTAMLNVQKVCPKMFADCIKKWVSIYKNKPFSNVEKSQGRMHKKIMYNKEKNSSLQNKITLTKREEEILKLLCMEYNSHEISNILFISKSTVDGHRTNLLKKTKCKNIVGLVKFALINDYISLDTFR